MLVVSTFSPLFAFLLVGLTGRFIGRLGAEVVVVVGVFVGILGFWFANLTRCEGMTTIIGGLWLEGGVSWGFIYDALSIEMGLLITTITLCIVIYATEYMFHDPYIVRFLSYLSLFSFFMLILVTASNLVQMFIGWEGVGLVSFLLINFWFMRLEANRSAIKAMIFNRIGDSFYLLAMLIAFTLWGSLDILLLNNLAYYPVSCGGVIDGVAICLFLAAVGKSAQLGLHAWLPDAMEGPTPVSALLHSATMVTAGVFVLVRFAPLLGVSTIGGWVIAVGALTALINALFGFFQWDLKKIIAFSTCSQLGLMVVVVVYDAQVGFYHLVNHGFFKALLFLSAGAVIHAVGDEQDIRRMGGLQRYLPFTSLCMLVGSFALVGFPFLSGFYSKEWVVFYPLTLGGWGAELVYLMLVLTSIFTALYSIKIMWFVFWSRGWRGGRRLLEGVHEPRLGMVFSMVVLSIFAVLFGFKAEDYFFNIGGERWGSAVWLSLNQLRFILELEVLGVSHKWFLIVFMVVGMSVFYGLRRRVAVLSWLKFAGGGYGTVFFWIVANRLGFISFYRTLAGGFLGVGYRIMFKLLDRGVFEKLGPTQIVRFFLQQKKGVRGWQSVKFIYTLWLFFGGGVFLLLWGCNYGYVVSFCIGLHFFCYLTKSKCGG